MLIGLIIATIVIALDQLSKYYVYSVILEDINYIAVTSFFNLIKAWNKGVSFSMFDNHGIIGVICLSAFAIIIVLFLLYLLFKEKSRCLQAAYGLIIGGAIGNVIDRIRLGAVFDFIDVYVGSYHWPAFNVADSCIFIGAFTIIIHSFLIKKDASEKA